MFAAPGIPVVLEGLWGDEAVLSGEGEELFRVLTAERGEGPVGGEFGSEALVDAEGSVFNDFTRYTESAVGLGDSEASFGESSEEWMPFDQRSIKSQRDARSFLGLRLQLREEIVK